MVAAVVVRSLARGSLSVAVLLAAGGAAAAAATPSPSSVTFHSTGAEKTWTVPSGVTEIGVEAIGGEGGGEDGGHGADVTSEVPVTPGHRLYVEVGATRLNSGPGGFNGGGSGGSGDLMDGPDPAGFTGGGGGGAVRAIRAGPTPRPRSTRPARR